jgi:hypothetical protein
MGSVGATRIPPAPVRVLDRPYHTLRVIASAFSPNGAHQPQASRVQRAKRLAQRSSSAAGRARQRIIPENHLNHAFRARCHRAIARSAAAAVSPLTGFLFQSLHPAFVGMQFVPL